MLPTIGAPKTSNDRKSRWDEAPLPHELRVSDSASKLIEFHLKNFIAGLESIKIQSPTGLLERKKALSPLTDGQLILVNNALVDICLENGKNMYSEWFNAINRILQDRNLEPSQIYSGELPSIHQTYSNHVNGNKVSLNPSRSIYKISL